MQAREVSISSSSGEITLHGVLFQSPAPGTSQPGGSPAPISDAVLVTHPHSLLGGCGAMMVPTAKSIARLGFTVLCIDCRGAGKSTGWASVTATTGEVEDVLAAADWLHSTMNAASVHIVGFSTGAAVGGSCLDKRDFIKGLVAIAYPFGGGWGVLSLASKLALGGHFNAVINSTKPRVFIMGNRDEITRVTELKSRFDACKGPKQIYIFQNEGHFSMAGPQALQKSSSIVEQYLRTYHHLDTNSL